LFFVILWGGEYTEGGFRKPSVPFPGSRRLSVKDVAPSSTGAIPPVNSSLGHWLARTCPDPAPDAALVRRFARDGDEAAFAALIDRHGPLVLGVACRVVRDPHAAEDVFQATFLLLARDAGRLRSPAALPAWLHHTARNLALTALRARRRRERGEERAPRRSPTSPLDDLSSRELLTVLDEELGRLPDAFRLPLILCCLEGRSLDEAATLLGWSPGSVKGRLERGRKRLKERLARRGLSFAVGAGVPLLADRPTVGALLRHATLGAARDGGVSAQVAALAATWPQPLRVPTWAAVLVVGAVGLLGAGLVSRPGSPERPADPAAAPPAAAAEDQPTPPRPDPLADPLPEGVVGRLGSGRLRIGNSAFALTPDGRTIVAVSPEGIVRTFDAQTGRLLGRRQLSDRTETDPTGQATAQLSADGKTVALNENVSHDIRVTVWDVESGKMLFRLAPAGGRSIGGCALAPDGKQLAVKEIADGRGHTDVLRVYDLETGRGKDLGSVEINVYDIRFTADGQRILASQTSGDGKGESTFVCFDVRSGKQLWRLPRKGQEFAVSPDGNTVVCAMFDGRFQVIEADPDSGKATERLVPCPQFQAHPNVRAALAPDNRTLVMNHFEGIILWDVKTGQQVRRFAPPANSGRGYGPELGAFSADGRTMLTNLGHLQRWDLTTGKPLFDEPPADGLGGPIERLAFTAGGKELLASSWNLTSARWEVATGKRLSLARERFGHQWVSTPAGLRGLQSDSRQGPHTVTVLDPVAGKPLVALPWAEPKEVGINGLRAYTLTANGKTLLVAHGDEPGPAPKSYVTACDVASGRRLARFTVPGNFYFPASPFSPCGRWVVLGGKVYHVGTGTELFTPSGEPSERLLPGDRWARAPVWFSQDGRLMAGLLSRKGARGPEGTDTLAVWELASGKVLARVAQAGFVAQAAFAPGGRTLALVDGWGIRIVDLLTGKRLTAYAAPDVTCDVTDRGCGTQTLVFAPDGRTLATGHRDGSVLLWKVPQPADDLPAEVTEAEGDRLWADLGSDSPGRARAAADRLVQCPSAAAARLVTRFRPVAAPADPAIAALVKDLDSDTFATREEATRRLREYGAKAEPALRRVLASSPSLDLRRRVEGLLESLPPPPLQLPVSGATLAGIRVIEVLERVRTPEARQQLQSWAEQAPDQRLVLEARAALERMGPAR
jgi:RNA polymerase sigma factor (sigma-70 family)